MDHDASNPENIFTQSNLYTMRKYFKAILISVLCISLHPLSGQNAIEAKVRSMLAEINQSTIVSPLANAPEAQQRDAGWEHIVRDAHVLKMDQEEILSIQREPARVMKMEVPVGKGRSKRLLLYRTELLTPDCRIYASSDRSRAKDFDPGVHYRGVIEGVPGSIASISFFEDEVMGMLSSGEGNLVIGKVANTNENLHLVYNDRHLEVSNPFDCATVDEGPGYTEHELKPVPASRSQGDCVRVYLEIDDVIVESKGSVVNATNFVLGLFHESFTIYENEGVPMKVSEVFVWDTSSPYQGINSTQSDMLDAFIDYLDGFNGDIGHLVSHRTSGGKSNGFNGLCHPDPDFSKCFSRIFGYYNEFPFYSWSAFVITHEMGHQLGSRHTHACVWNGDATAIDGCAGYTEGGCPVPEAPDTLGTIMSYCYGTPGVDLTKGFGQQPGNVIRNSVLNASCLGPQIEPLENDIAIIGIMSPQSNYCGNSIIPEIEISNSGSSTVSAVDIEYTIDGNPGPSLSWAGTLQPGEKTSVLLPDTILVGEGSHLFEVRAVNPNGSPDPKPGDNLMSKTFGSGSISLTFSAVTNYPRFYAFSVFNEDGISIATFGPYLEAWAGDLVTESFCLPEGCYRFAMVTMIDSLFCCANENRYYKLEDAGGNVLVYDFGFDQFESTMFCIPSSANSCALHADFDSNPLTHLGTGASSSSTILTFSPPAAGIDFMISDLDSKEQGNPSSRYRDIVNVHWTDAHGNEHHLGPYSGSNQNEVDVSIQDFVSSVSVELSNPIGNGGAVASVDLSPVSYCGPGTPCPDTDGDGVCDDSDLCPGYNDNIDVDNDGIPDGCDPCIDSDNDTVCDPADECPGEDDTVDDNNNGIPDCTECPDQDVDGVCDADDVCPGGDDRVDNNNNGTPDDCEGCPGQVDSYFSPNPLMHSGTGSTNSDVNLGSFRTDISFTISNIGAQTGGKPSKRYIEVVEVFADGILVAEASGEQQPGLEVNIPGPAQIVSVILFDGYDGNVEEGEMSIDFSDVTSCPDAGSGLEAIEGIHAEGALEIEFEIYPNPARDQLIIRDHADMESVKLYTLTGQLIRQAWPGMKMLRLSLDQVESGTYLVHVSGDNGRPRIKRVIVLK